MRILPALTLAAAASLSPMAPVHAGAIESACLRSDRPAANRSLCGCIQRVADQTLTRGDQRLAASFFRDPDRAQEVRMSTSSRDNEFWDRYRAFADRAEAVCAG